MKLSLRYIFIASASFGLSLSYSNCSKVDFSSTPSVLASGTPDATSTPQAPTGPIVCNPFGGTTTTSKTQGLVAKGVAYVNQSALAANQTPEDVTHSSVETLIANENSSPLAFSRIDMFLNSINFPAMYFSQGFLDTTTGTPLKDQSGNVLTSYFGFRLQSVFVAGDWPEGDYQISSLTDDGSVLTMTGAQADGSDFIINNDGEHSMNLGCSSNVVHISPGSQIPLTMDYMQGPPITIGLMLMYRPVSISKGVQDPLCGQGGNSDSFYFLDHDSKNNPLNPSQPQAPYLQLTGSFNSKTGSGGWQVVEANHYTLPSTYTNPCAP